MSKASEIVHKKLLSKIGDKIKEERVRLGISQEKLALMAGVHRTYIGVIERAEQNLTVGVVKQICDVLGMSLAEFFAEFIERKPIKTEYTKKVKVSILKK